MKALIFDLSIPKYVMLSMTSWMSKKLYYRGPLSMLKLADVPEPDIPSADWVKIKTRLCGFCGSDLSLILLKTSPMSSPFTSFPSTPGHEVCGEVMETGRNVKNCRAGDLVTIFPPLGCAVRGITPECPACKKGRPGNCENFARGTLAPGMLTGLCTDAGGGFAEYLVAHKSQVYRIPNGVSPESAALVEPLAVGLQTVLDNRPENRDRVLIIGGGVIGVMIVKSIRALGIRSDITVIEPSSFSAAYAEKSGADHVTSAGIIEAAGEFTGAHVYQPVMGERILQGGFDRVYDTVGNSKTLQASLIATAACGTVSIVGIGNTVKFDPTPLWLKLQTVKGVYAYGEYSSGGGKKRHVFDFALDLLKRKKIYVDDMLTHTFPIEKYRELVEVNLNKGENRAIKTALRF